MSWVFRCAFAVLAVVSMPLLAAACGSSSNPGQTGTTTGSGGGTPDYGTSACGTCVEQTACLSQLNGCASDPSCAAYLNCLNQCPLGPSGDADSTCEKACPAVTGSAGQAARSAFIDCRLSGPGSACDGCGQIPAPTNPDFHQMCSPSTDPDKCFKCEETHCCDTYQSCHTDTECVALVMCVQACISANQGLPCEDQCYQDHSAGYEHYAHRFACVFQFCPDVDACGNAPLDPCVKCTNLHCADESAACEEDLQCTLLRDCQTPCMPTDQACYMACETSFPAGKANLTTWLDCTAANCSLVCGGSS